MEVKPPPPPAEHPARPVAADRAALRPWQHWALLAGLVLGATLLRAWTIRQALPFVDHPDEPNPIEYVLGMLRTGDPNQHAFQKPSLYIYMLLAALQVHYAWGQATGLYGDLHQMVVTTYTVTTIPGFFLTARLVTLTFAALTVLSAYALGVRGWSRTAGLVGALFIAVLPLHVRFAQWATTDIMASFLASLSLGAALVVLQTGRWRAYLVAGAFAGLAASAKYNAGAVAGAIVVAALLRAWSARRVMQEARPLTVAGLAAVVAFIAGTPYALLSWGQVGGGIARQWQNYGGANGHYRGAWNVAGYAEFFLNDGLGRLGCVFVVAGLVLLGRQHPRILLVWLGFVLPSLLVHLSRMTHFMQNMLPLLVACALPVGVAVTTLADMLIQRAPALRRWALPFLLAALVLPPLAHSLAYMGRQAAGDSRLQLLDWLATSVPPGTRLAAELKAVPGPTEARWTEIPDLTAHDLAWYRAQGFAYLVASSAHWGQLEPPTGYAPFLKNVVTEFGPRLRAEEQTGPRLLVITTGLTVTAVPLPLAQDVQIGGARLVGVAVGDPAADGAPPMLVPTTTFKAGGVLGLRTFWQVGTPFTQDYLIFVHVLAANGERPTQRDASPWQGRFPTTSWQSGTLVVDANDVYLPPAMPPGDYRVLVGMYDPVSGTRPSVTADGGPLPDGAVEVARVRVVP